MKVSSRPAWIQRLHGLLPRGSGAVGAGVAVYGLTSYAFLVLAGRALGPTRYAALSALWAIVYVLAPGFFVPVEQEVNRLIASRQTLGEGAASLVRRSLALAGLVVIALSAIAIGVGRSVVDRIFDGDVLLFVALILALIGYAVQHVFRGALAGLGNFRRYAAILIVEGLVRVGICSVLSLTALSSAGPYGLALALAAIVSLFPGMGLLRVLDRSNSAPPWSELTKSIGLLIVSAVFAQFLAVSEPLVVKLLSPPGSGIAGKFLASLVIARIPIFLFQAIQPPLLYRLSNLATARRWAALRSSVTSMLAGVVLAGTITILTAATIGPWIVTTLFGSGFALGRINLVYLAGGTACYLVAVGIAQALIALSLQSRVAASWVAGSIVFSVRVAIGSALVPRVAQGFLLGSAVAAALMGTALARGLRRRASSLPPFPGAIATEP